MSLILLNLQSNQQIILENDNPLIIGRGNVEGCFDKRVSRNHGRIRCTVDGKIHLLALHCNPCFFTRNGVPPVFKLNKDEEETLKEGDCLGLLPNAFWFKIISHKEVVDRNEAKECNILKNVKSSDENITTMILPENSSKSSSEGKKRLKHEGAKDTLKDEHKDHSNFIPVSASNTELNSTGSSNSFGSPEFEKTRRLPLWMYEIDEVVETDKSPSKQLISNIKETRKKNQKAALETNLEIKAEIKLKDDVKDITNLNIPSTSKVENIEPSRPTNTSQTEFQNIIQAQDEAVKECNQKRSYERDAENERHIAVKRPICYYEGKCYRKNPDHKLKFCHPGDLDYVPYEERPLCQYGAACYRRNEKHEVEYRHPPPATQSFSSPSSCSLSSVASSPLPAKRTRKQVKLSFDNEDYDEYDLEEPFVNDASSDEYIPSDLDSEEEDDLATF